MGIKHPSAVVTSSILALVSADRRLAQIAIADHAGGKASELAAANAEMAKALVELNKGHFDAAILHYQAAWGHAVKGLTVGRSSLSEAGPRERPGPSRS